MVNTRSAGPSGKLRRSARLNGIPLAESPRSLRDLEIQGSSSTRRRRRRVSFNIINAQEDQGGSVEDHNSTKVYISNDDSTCRKRALGSAECELATVRKELDRCKQESEDIRKEKDAETTLKYLEEHFTCALCYEVIACPYSLANVLCGHTFCALCSLKWFFSRIHRECGAWHESVECPLCRSKLPYTPDDPPRHLATFPFFPNRMTADFVSEMIEKLGQRGLPDSTDGCIGSESRALSLVKKEESVPLDLGSGVNAWAQGGGLRRDWKDRERKGRQEMEDVLKRWRSLKPVELVSIANRLGV